MKKILILLAVVGLTFTSCYQDEYEAPSGVIINEAFFATASEEVATSTTDYDITINFSSATANDIILSYTVDGTNMQMTVPAGSTSAVLASVDISATGTVHTAVLNYAASNGENFTIDTNRKKFYVLIPYAANPGNMHFILNWGDSSYDMDLYIINAANGFGTVLDYSWYDFPEEVDFPEIEADGTYYIYTNEYEFTADIPVSLVAIEPDGTNHVFIKTVTKSGDMLSFTKTTDTVTGNVTYSYIEL